MNPSQGLQEAVAAKAGLRVRGPADAAREGPPPQADLYLAPEPVALERPLRRDAIFRGCLALADALAAAVALLAAVAASGPDRLRAPALLALPAIVGMSKLLGLYDRDELLLHKATFDEAPGLFQLATLFSIFVWLSEAVLIEGAFAKVEFVALWSTLFASLMVLRSRARWLAFRAAPAERCLLLGNGRAYDLVRSKLPLGGGGTELVAHEELEDEAGEVRVAGELRALARRHDIHRVILAPEATDSDAVLDLIREAKASGLKISLLPRFSEVLGSSVLFDDLHGLTVLAVRRFGLSRSSRLLKRAFDLSLTTLGLLVVGPLMALVALAVRLDSPGPILFRQRRIGLAGRPFEILKFRTMVREADQLKAELEHLNEADGLFKIADDPRVTRVGRFLRRTSLDELPQLINVMRGNMSLVGPRPLVIEDDRRVVGWHRERLKIQPGMTGHWQVLGSSRVPLREMVAIDYLYVANWSLWTDLKYLVRTVPLVLRARGL
jgi:exopolysaccharide biosynthesis polyprenyl glycosylphosphotransferase